MHDIVLGQSNWQPTTAELKAISAEMIKLASRDLKIERLDVNTELALEMFKDNCYKTQQLPSIASQAQGRIALYRMGTHIDISRGPMVAASRFLGKCTIAAAHAVVSEAQKEAVYRIQGVALPTGFILNHVAYGTLEQRARKMVSCLFFILFIMGKCNFILSH